jgi:hypothetical protein
MCSAKKAIFYHHAKTPSLRDLDKHRNTQKEEEYVDPYKEQLQSE